MEKLFTAEGVPAPPNPHARWPGCPIRVYTMSEGGMAASMSQECPHCKDWVCMEWCDREEVEDAAFDPLYYAQAQLCKDNDAPFDMEYIVKSVEYAAHILARFTTLPARHFTVICKHECEGHWADELEDAALSLPVALMGLDRVEDMLVGLIEASKDRQIVMDHALNRLRRLDEFLVCKPPAERTKGDKSW